MTCGSTLLVCTRMERPNKMHTLCLLACLRKTQDVSAHPHLRLAQDLRNTPELIALAVNLTQNVRNAEVRDNHLV